MAIKYPITLSTTESNNNIGLLKIRQADEETQMLVVQILEDAIPKSYDGLQVFFCARIGQTPGLGIIEQKLTEDEMTDPKKENSNIHFDLKTGKYWDVKLVISVSGKWLMTTPTSNSFLLVILIMK